MFKVCELATIGYEFVVTVCELCGNICEPVAKVCEFVVNVFEFVVTIFELCGNICESVVTFVDWW